MLEIDPRGDAIFQLLDGLSVLEAVSLLTGCLICTIVNSDFPRSEAANLVATVAKTLPCQYTRVTAMRPGEETKH